MRKFSLFLVVCGIAWGIAFSARTIAAQSSIVSSSAAGPPHLLTTVAQVRELSNTEAAKSIPVELHAIVTYYQPTEGQVFVQDATGGIYIASPPNPAVLNPGDAVLVRGTTVPSYSVNVKATEMKFEHRADFPEPVALSWREFLKKSNDCRYVTISGKVRSATLQASIGQFSQGGVQQRGMSPAQIAESIAKLGGRQPYLLIDLQTEGGLVRVHMENVLGIDPFRLLDAQVSFTGVAGGLFDGKFQLTGAELWVSTAQHMRILSVPPSDPTQLPLTSINHVMLGSFVRDESQRIHLRGSVTLYQPGLEMVLQTAEGDAVEVNSFEQTPLSIGQVVDVVGFPDPHQYSEALTDANVLPTEATQPIEPKAVNWTDTIAGRYPFNLISMEGKLAAEVHEPHQDTLVIQAGPHVFSAILPRTVWNQDLKEAVLPDYPIGSTVRIAGVCFVHAGGPWNTERWFDLQLRTPEDVTVLVAPSWWTVRRLLYVSAALLFLMLTALVWAFMLQNKVRRQSEQIRVTMESEAARERRIAFLEKERGRVLEAINSMLNMDDVLLMILRLISTQLEDRSCWCELANGTIVGQAVASQDSIDVVRRGIYSGAGERLGSVVVSGAEACQEQAGEALEMGASLAALAIDNRRLYETLIHRSQYDQLTNAANRFLLESRLDEALNHAKRSHTHFALVYIDLDQFKQVNDFYGHRAGDVYLQQVAERLSEKLRGMDTLARVGGDEFIALIPVVRNRGEVGEIIDRLSHCFDAPFAVDDYTISGSASIGYALYPEDGATKDELKRVADAAMYANKPHAAV
ncbi:MAG TPA: GGDEF domain-containing protein [Acidobacteriaceae bacterium]|nr:GGDEF domain-containing protein [Acidobacteriaceae bacterium]